MAGIWAKVISIRRDLNRAVAVTQDEKKIFISLKYAKLLDQLEKGDIVQFDSLNRLDNPGVCSHYGISPVIIGYAPEKVEPLPVTRACERALEWKDKSDKQADSFANEVRRHHAEFVHR